jgi:tol-pal system protein YbgF
VILAAWRRGAAALALGGATLAAQAGLFDDDEARKAILDLRARITQADDAAKARHAELAASNQRLAETVQQLQRSLLELNNQLEAMRVEVARLRGSDEQLARDVAELQKRQRDIAQGVDDRIRRMEPLTVTAEGAEFLAQPDEKRQFDEALGLLRGGEFDKAATAFGAFQRRWPGSGYTDAARFWLGNALYGKRDYKEAIATLRAFVAAAPGHPRAPEALLAVANSQVEMKDGKGAKKTIDELVKAYPGSEAAQAGKGRLASIR